nr:hypothetical protein Itr_chr15CG11750 [Ipomoea trifida]
MVAAGGAPRTTAALACVGCFTEWPAEIRLPPPAKTSDEGSSGLSASLSLPSSLFWPATSLLRLDRRRLRPY